MSFLVTTSWDDGAVEDLKLAELLSRYDIPATFYVPLKNEERAVISRSQIRSLSRSFEIGGHTYNHIDLTQVSHQKARDEILKGKYELEEIVGDEIQSFAYPKGNYNKTVKQLVGLSGFEFARTTQLFKTRFSDPLEIGTTIHAYNHHKLLLCSEFMKPHSIARIGDCIRSWDELARAYLDYCIEQGGGFHLWGHSWEIEQYGQWAALESLFRYIRSVTTKQSRVVNTESFQTLYLTKNEYYRSVDVDVYHESQIQQHSDDLSRLQPYLNEYDVSGNRVLDAGCGTGRLAEYIKNAEYRGIDISEQFIDFARKRYGNKTHVFEAEDVLQMKQSRLFDLIIVWGLLEDRANPYHALSMLLKSLKKGGKLVFTVHTADSLVFTTMQQVRKSLGVSFPATSFSADVLELYGAVPKGFRQNIIDSGTYTMVELSRL